MKIVFAADHAGYALKEELKRYVASLGHEIVDVGTNSTESVDYPDFGEKAGEVLASGDADRAVLVCGTGIGISIAACKLPGVIAAVCTNEFMARMSRRHNGANAVGIGARVVGSDLAREIVRAWLEEEPEGGRHEGRRDKIAAIEKKYASRQSS